MRFGKPFVDCTVCGKPKKPRGRDAPMLSAGTYCDPDCDGYYRDPMPDNLWPGEAETFGPCPLCEDGASGRLLIIDGSEYDLCLECNRRLVPEDDES